MLLIDSYNILHLPVSGLQKMNIDDHGSDPKDPPAHDANQCNHEAANHGSGSNGAARKNKGHKRMNWRRHPYPFVVCIVFID